MAVKNRRNALMCDIYFRYECDFCHVHLYSLSITKEDISSFLH